MDLVDMAVNVLQREFDKKADAAGVSDAYKKSFRMERDGNKITAILDYKIDDKPVGLWLEKGTRAHYIRPVDKQALSWVTDGVRFFSQGHWVSGIKPNNIMVDTREAFITEFVKESLRRE